MRKFSLRVHRSGVSGVSPLGLDPSGVGAVRQADVGL